MCRKKPARFRSHDRFIDGVSKSSIRETDEAVCEVRSAKSSGSVEPFRNQIGKLALAKGVTP